MSEAPGLLLLAHVAATLAMTGLIWFVQVVHYPLFAQVGREGFADYERRHTSRTTFVVAPLMLVEAATGVWLVWWRPAWPSLLGLGLLALIWLSTFLGQVPEHGRLGRGFDPGSHRRLVAGNWIRTVAWTGRAAIVLGILGSAA